MLPNHASFGLTIRNYYTGTCTMVKIGRSCSKIALLTATPMVTVLACMYLRIYKCGRRCLQMPGMKPTHCTHVTRNKQDSVIIGVGSNVFSVLLTKCTRSTVDKQVLVYRRLRATIESLGMGIRVPIFPWESRGNGNGHSVVWGRQWELLHGNERE